MSEEEKRAAETMVQALTQLPEAQREYLIGFSEGVAAMADRMKEAEKK